MSFLNPKSPPPLPPPPLPPVVNEAKAATLAEENVRRQRGKRKGQGSTIVAGALGDSAAPGQPPTLMG